MPDNSNKSEQPGISAGDFAPWLTDIGEAIGGEHSSEVPCAGCTACCTSSQFVHIEPDETGTLAHIPPKLLFPAPFLPRGHLVLGYDERGRCPMLIDNRCSIYEHRPRTCRVYDCRIFAAAGLAAECDKPSIARQAQRWRFGFPSEDDRTRYAAVRAAAAFIRAHPDLLPAEAVGMNTTRLAVLAIQVHEVFLRRDEATGRLTLIDPDPEAVRAEVMRHVGTRPAPPPPGPRSGGRRVGRRRASRG